MIEKKTIEVTPELLEQNPLLAMALTGMSLLVIAVLVGSVVCWGYLIVKARRGEPWLSAEPRGPRAWGLADLVVVAVLVVACQTLFASAYVRLSGMELGNIAGKPVPAAVSTAASFGNLAAIGLTLAWLALRFQVSPSHVGFLASGWLRHVRIAGVAILTTLPIVYLLMAVVSIGLDTSYQHPLLDEIRATATLGSYLLGVVTAVLLAPLAEEFLFRVMIQGWLQSWPASSATEILLGASPSQRADRRLAELIPASVAAMENAQPTVIGESQDLRQSFAEPPVVASTASTTEASTAFSNLDETYVTLAPPLWPAVVTGILFGLAHWGYGLSFIPLIVLGIVLGLTDRATNSIWPCFLVHFALNSLSMLGLGLSILIERAGLVALLMNALWL